jgi:S1-C subfamily serine protease
MTSSVLVDWASARRATVAQALLGVVGIERSRGRGFSGIVWDADTVVTAAEALKGAESVRVRTNTEQLEAEIVAMDLSVDVAVLQVRTGAPPVSAAPATSLRAGDDVLIAGRKRGLPLVVWSAAQQLGPPWRSQSGGDLARFVRLSPALHPSLEGGGIFELDGRLCAMAVPDPRGQTIGIPVETIAKVVTVRQHGRLPQPYLGVRLQPVWLDERLREQLAKPRAASAIVVGVDADSPAASAGLLFGDLLLTVNSQLIESALDLKAALSRVPLGSSVRVQLYRAGERKETDVLVRERIAG